MQAIDKFLDQISMYRLVLYLLIFLILFASFLGYLNLVPFSPGQILFSSILLIFISWTTNKFFSLFLKFPSAIESSFITALILALIFSPAITIQNYALLCEVGFIAIASKYLLAINKRHIFNPAAAAAVIIGFFYGASASWWVGTAWMIPPTLIVGFLIIRKLQFEKLVGSYLLASFILFTLFVLTGGQNLVHGYIQIFLNSSILFFAFIMLTEPATLPPTKEQRVFYAVLIAILTLPQVHFGTIYLSPEMALVIGNIFSFVVGPRQNLILQLKNKKAISSDVVEFSFLRNKNFNYLPGQYMEWTIPHPKTDARGNRRYFTLSSSPTEEEIAIGVKFYQNGSSYKKDMFNIDEKKLVKAGSLSGNFTLPRNKNKKLMFIAGGIGVTPYRSMIKYLIDKNEKRDIVLLYSNTSESEIAYKEIFDKAYESHNIKTYYFLTGENVSNEWQGERGRINKDVIINKVPDYKVRLIYISGPMPFVNGIKKTLIDLDVSARNIKTDFFPGYA